MKTGEILHNTMAFFSNVLKVISANRQKGGHIYQNTKICQKELISFKVMQTDFRKSVK